MHQAVLKRNNSLDYMVKEGINTLYSNITFAGSDIKTVAFTSCDTGDGKTYVSLALARDMAAMGKRVCLVDCDLRKSRLVREEFELTSGPRKGTTHYLANMASLDDVLYSTNIRNLFLVPCTKSVANSLPLVNSPRLQQLLEELAEQMDYVVVDTAPIGLLIDAAKVASLCDGTVIVVTYNQTRKRELVEACRQIDAAGCNILGTVINHADFNDYLGRKYYGKKYYSGYYYQSSDNHVSSSSSEGAPRHSSKDEKAEKAE